MTTHVSSAPHLDGADRSSGGHLRGWPGDPHAAREIGHVWLHLPTGAAGLTGIRPHHDNGPVPARGFKLLEATTPEPLPAGDPPPNGRPQTWKPRCARWAGTSSAALMPPAGFAPPGIGSASAGPPGTCSTTTRPTTPPDGSTAPATASRCSLRRSTPYPASRRRAERRIGGAPCRDPAGQAGRRDAGNRAPYTSGVTRSAADNP